MSDNLDPPDDIQSILQKFQTVTTIEQNSNIIDQMRHSTMNATTPYSSTDEKKSHVSDEAAFERNLPELNLPEKILLIVDTIRESNATPFKFGSGAKCTPLQMIKKVVEMFVIAKSSLQRGHEFALMTMDTASTHWICDFTSSVKTILNHLNIIFEDIQEDAVQEQEGLKIYDMGQVFEKLQEHVFLPDTKDGVLPAFVTRVILIYSRSKCIPKFHTGRQFFEGLTENQYFFLDSLYVHEPPSEDNQCEEIYKELSALDVKGFSYIFEVGRISRKIYDDMAKLMAHPLQRPLQPDTCYRIFPNTNVQEVHTNV